MTSLARRLVALALRGAPALLAWLLGPALLVVLPSLAGTLALTVGLLVSRCRRSVPPWCGRSFTR